MHPPLRRLYAEAADGGFESEYALFPLATAVLETTGKASRATVARLVAFDPPEAVFEVDADVRFPAGSYPKILVGVGALAPLPRLAGQLTEVVVGVGDHHVARLGLRDGAAVGVVGRVNVELAAVEYWAVDGSTRCSCSSQLL